MKEKKKRTFTLIELLVVIAIIAIAAAGIECSKRKGESCILHRQSETDWTFQQSICQ